MSAEDLEFCRDTIRRVMVWEARVRDLDREIEQIEREVRRRLHIRASIRQRTKPTAGQRAATIISLMDARLNGTVDRLDGRDL